MTGKIHLTHLLSNISQEHAPAGRAQKSNRHFWPFSLFHNVIGG